MAYYSRHSIFLYDNDKQKLLYLQTLIEEEELSFELREETVYQYDGEPLNMLCISDANYGLCHHGLYAGKPVLTQRHC